MNEALLRALSSRLPDGSRAIVPVLGSGLNVNACGGAEDWDGLLDRVCARVGLPDRDAPGGSMTARWESLLAHLAGARGLAANKAETSLQREVVTALEELERGFAARPFYGTVLDGGFRDVISLNFDRRLPLHARVRGVVAPRRRKPPRDPSLFRHAIVLRNGVETRIWFPHGDTASRSTLKLGVRAYGRYIADLEWARGRHKRRERIFHGETGGDAPAWRAHVRRADGSGELTWLDVLLASPLVFVGCGLSADEWPLWWALHQRDRNLARCAPAERPPAWALWHEKVPRAHLEGRRAGLDVATAPTFPALWDLLG